MTRTMFWSLAAAAILAMAVGGLVQSKEASAAERKGKGANIGLLGWATFPNYNRQPRTHLRSTKGGPEKKGKSSTWVRVGQPPGGTSSTARSGGSNSYGSYRLVFPTTKSNAGKAVSKPTGSRRP